MKKMEKKTKIKSKVKLLLFTVFLCLISVGFIYYSSSPLIVLDGNSDNIELHGNLDAKKYIKDMRQYDFNDIQIDSSKVNVDKIGDYQIIYRIKDKEYTYDIHVVDTIPPTFDAQDVDIDLGMNVDIDKLVSNIKDESKTKTYWKKKYSFDKAGTFDATIVVEDESQNKTEKVIKVNIVKDDEKPVLSGLRDFHVYVGDKINYLSAISAKDNRDPHPKISVDSSRVNLKKAGSYDVKYSVKDRSGNENTYIKKVIVKEKKSVNTVPTSSDKVVYLTFDDGPSANTQKILEVLDKYNAKATFFVTGNGKKYNYLIKRAYQKGHTIGLHTYSHNYNKLYSSVEAYFNDLTQIGNMVQKEIGFVPHYIRFPGGSSNTVSKKLSPGIMSILVNEVQNRGYQYYDWNASSTDAARNNVPVSTIVKSSTSYHSNNIMILMHDTQAKTTTVQALPQIIEYYQSKGYTFKGIDDQSFTPHHRVNN